MPISDARSLITNHSTSIRYIRINRICNSSTYTPQGAHQRGSHPSSLQDIHRTLRTQQGQPSPPRPWLSTAPLRCAVVTTRRQLQPLAAAASTLVLAPLGVGPAPLAQSGITTGGLALVPVRRRAAGAAVPPRRSRGTGVAAITAVVPAASRTTGLPRSPPARPPQPNTRFRGFEEVNLLTLIKYWVQQWGRAPVHSWVRRSGIKKKGQGVSKWLTLLPGWKRGTFFWQSGFRQRLIRL